MAKEPHFIRRVLADRIKHAIAEFPYDREAVVRHMSFMPSYYPGTAYIFLQLDWPESTAGYYDTEYRPRRRTALARVRALAQACCQAWLETDMGAYKPRFA